MVRQKSFVSRGIILLVLVKALVTVCNGTAAHFIDVTGLVESSDLIVSGRITSVDERGPTIIELPGQTASGKAFSAVIKVDRALKGIPESPSVLFVFFIPDSRSAFRPIRAGQYGMFFLQHGTSGYSVSDPLYPFLPAMGNVHQSAGVPLDRVIAELGEVLTRGQSPGAESFSALDALGTIQGKSATETLRNALQTSSGELQLRIASKLVARNDITGLDVVARALLDPTQSHSYLLAYLAGSLGGLKDPRSVPTLKRLVETDNPYIVKGSAIALRQSGSVDALLPLSRLLNNSDEQVRYYAVVGLGEITKQDEWTPAFDEFHSREGYYISYWRQWASANLTSAGGRENR